MKTSNQPDDSKTRADRLMDEMGFDLREVTWGYQEIFREVIGELCSGGLLGEESKEVTRSFFDMLRRSDKSGFDMVLKSYLDALRGQHRWIMRLPRLFDRWTQVGLELAEERYYLGARFFEYCGEGELGESPEELEFVLDLIAQLQTEEADLIPALMEGCTYLRENLHREGIREYIGHALTLYDRNPDSARKFLAGELETSQVYVDRLSRQANLDERKEALERLTQALCGYEVPVDDLGSLDSDDLQERGSQFICCAAGMYLPASISVFSSSRRNRHAYRTLVTLGCATLTAGGFATVHGQEEISTCRDVVAGQMDNMVSCALFYIAETHRIIQYARRIFPGINPMLDRFIGNEFSENPPRSGTDRILAASLGYDTDLPDDQTDIVGWLSEIAEKSEGFAKTRELIREWRGRFSPEVVEQCAYSAPRALSFFPDPLFPLNISEAPPEKMKADMHDVREVEKEEERAEEQADEEETAEEAEEDGEGSAEEAEGEQGQSGGVGYWYDEWNQGVNDYQRDWCRVVEKEPREGRATTELSDSALKYARKVQEVFERLKPEEVKMEKRLLEGDAIHIDHLIEYLSEGEERQGADMRFYNKPLINRRDLAISVLLDVSGSTGEEAEAAEGGKPYQAVTEFGGDAEDRSVLQVEKEAAYVMGTGLDKLGDTFAMYGFTGNGRENCLFYRFKEFDEDWDDDTVQSLLSAAPGSATRIGAALRHTGWKLSQRPEKTRLLLLITDGKPCDQGYDTESQYAQHDIRKACQENRRQDIHTFCVSTSENTPADMELMFPGGRYIILEDIRKLPRVLSRLYLRLTR